MLTNKWCGHSKKNIVKVLHTSSPYWSNPTQSFCKPLSLADRKMRNACQTDCVASVGMWLLFVMQAARLHRILEKALLGLGKLAAPVTKYLTSRHWLPIIAEPPTYRIPTPMIHS